MNLNHPTTFTRISALPGPLHAGGTDMGILPLGSVLIVPWRDNCHLKFCFYCQECGRRTPEGHDFSFFLCVVPQDHKLCSANLLDAIRSSWFAKTGANRPGVQGGGCEPYLCLHKIWKLNKTNFSGARLPGSWSLLLMSAHQAENSGKILCKNKLVLHMCWL